MTYSGSRNRNEIRRLTRHIYMHTVLPTTRSMVLIKTTRPAVAIYSFDADHVAVRTFPPTHRRVNPRCKTFLASRHSRHSAVKTSFPYSKNKANEKNPRPPRLAMPWRRRRPILLADVCIKGLPRSLDRSYTYSTTNAETRSSNWIMLAFGKSDPLRRRRRRRSSSNRIRNWNPPPQR